MKQLLSFSDKRKSIYTILSEQLGSYSLSFFDYGKFIVRSNCFVYVEDVKGDIVIVCLERTFTFISRRENKTREMLK